jgi:hypothetical protein
VAQVYNPSYLGGRDRKDCGSDQPRLRAHKTPTQPMAEHGGVCYLRLGDLNPFSQSLWGKLGVQLQNPNF